MQSVVCERLCSEVMTELYLLQTFIISFECVKKLLNHDYIPNI